MPLGQFGKGHYGKAGLQVIGNKFPDSIRSPAAKAEPRARVAAVAIGSLSLRSMTFDQVFQAAFTWVGGIVAVGGSSAAIAYGLFRWLGKGWLDQQFKKQLERLKHDQQKEIEQLRHQINSLFSRVSKIHEKEFEVLPRAWTLLHEAHGAVFRVVSALKEYPDFARMSEPQFEAFVSSCRLEEFQKEELRKAENRLQCYQNWIFWIELNDAKTAQVGLNNYLAVNSIFMTDELRQQFKAINQSLQGVLIDEDIARRPGAGRIPSNNEAMEKVSQLFTKIETAVQKRLRYEEA